MNLKMPESVADQIMLIFALTVFGCTSTMVSLALQGKPIPADFKDFTEKLAFGVLGGYSFNKLTN
jgi:hypothetical protein